MRALTLPSSPAFWRSPLRGPRFTSLLGMVLLAGIPVVFATGLLSYAAYNPDLAPVNDQTPDKGLLGGYLFAWPTDPHWLYRLTQGVHVTLGITLVPVLLAKLWSVIPKLFAVPPARSLAGALERLSLLALVGGALFVMATGVLNIQLEYLFPGSFYRLHFYGAWVFVAAFLLHVALRLPAAVRALRRGTGGPTDGAGEPHGTIAVGPPPAPSPDPPTTSRRGALWFVGGGSLLLLGTTVGRSFDGPLRATALLAPHGWEEPGSGPGGFQVNKTAASVGVTPDETAADVWRLHLVGPAGTARLSRADLAALPQHTAALPIACVEGWSTSDQQWRGVRLRDLARLAGHGEGPTPDLLVTSLQRSGAFRRAALRANQVDDPRSLLSLEVNGAPLTPDHGFPARVIVPAAPGVLNTKWVSRMEFRDLSRGGGDR
ncbi:molybdopterin-dependent oxidoreductase [Streptomyces lonarensis]|uniref:Molybdopterin-dependent oxidoreductase n=1 Tax=Streptomyces lonarensis TaxID=700599 RepID=A0A7X6D214_9ACTN|nr:molybdopterin-dependent oxidoreductase [Streptomyces lonarensis]NJQ06687.1 molybdopterin-dependent oxidoreductase [Streptomyces lonarensis]